MFVQVVQTLVSGAVYKHWCQTTTMTPQRAWLRSPWASYRQSERPLMPVSVIQWLGATSTLAASRRCAAGWSGNRSCNGTIRWRPVG